MRNALVGAAVITGGSAVGDARGCAAGLEAAETAICAGMLKLGGSVLVQLLAAGPGYGGPRVDCGAGHQAE